LSLDEICRQGAQRMLGAALEAEAGAYVESFVDELDGDGHRLVVRNGHARARQVTTVAGAVEVTAPRVNDQRVDAESGERCGFKSSIVPPWARKSPKVTEVTEVLPLLYLHGMSTGDFSPALEGFFGNAAGLSASTVGRLTESWQDEHRAFAKRSLADRDFVYVWVDGVHFNVRLDEARLCCLVVLGVRLDGTKELVAITDGYRESTESWADLLRDLKRRGMRAPMLAVGDGALGFWAALKDIWPDTAEQRCWFHKTGTVLNALAKAAQPTAKLMLGEIHGATDKDEARKAIGRFAAEYRRSSPRPSSGSSTTPIGCWRSRTSRPSIGST
jgi:transposase-like protein